MGKYKIETILVPFDFSETSDNALTRAVDLAVKIKAKLVLVHVVEVSHLASSRDMISTGLITDSMASAARQNLKELSSKIKLKNNIKVEYACYSGNIYDNIIRATLLFNASLIVMGTHGTSGIREWLFGSNAFSVVNNTTIPTLTFNQHSAGNTFKKIVFPFNENLLTLKKIEQVVTLAEIFNASILLLGYTLSNTPSVLKSLQEKGAELAEQFAEKNIKSTFSIATGENYADEILRFALEEKADMITVVTNKGHNIDKVFKSKSERKIVIHSEIPVLSVPVE